MYIFLFRFWAVYKNALFIKHPNYCHATKNLVKLVASRLLA